MNSIFQFNFFKDKSLLTINKKSSINKSPILFNKKMGLGFYSSPKEEAPTEEYS
jgi:hypothetical protein